MSNATTIMRLEDQIIEHQQQLKDIKIIAIQLKGHVEFLKDMTFVNCPAILDSLTYYANLIENKSNDE